MTIDELKNNHYEGFPPSQDSAVGWYLVRLAPGHSDERLGKKFDVDYWERQKTSDGDKFQWVNWYKHNILECWRLPNEY